ncbi:MAG: hypothetical protein LV473_15985 [Nitrospira sp.]|nr:hypothetical protein [Nitrospira sp.]
MRRLQGPNPGAAEAAQKLALLNDKTVIPDLLASLTSQDIANEVPLTIEVLGRIGDKTTPRAILDKLRPTAPLYPRLVEAFERLGASSAEWFELSSTIATNTSYRRTPYHDSDRYRIKAIERLGWLGGLGLISEVVPILEALAGDRIRPGSGDDSRFVRKAARDILNWLVPRPHLVRGAYSDDEIQFIVDSLTAWTIVRNDGHYSPQLYDYSQLFRPKLTTQNVRAHLGSAGIAAAIAVVATEQWIQLTTGHSEAEVARTFVYTPYLQGVAAELVHERES